MRTRRRTRTYADRLTGGSSVCVRPFAWTFIFEHSSEFDHFFENMFGQSLMRANGLKQSVRYFRGNALLRSTNGVSRPVAESVTKSSAPSKPVDPEQVLGARMHKCSNFDKWMLVWMKKFPSKEEVPAKVTLDMLQKVQTKARIRVANLMIVATVIGCIWAVMSGKKDAKAGRSLGQENQNWHEKINREYKESLAAGAKTT